tara:strand:- start:2761 stop:4581 length:1821 start_codon:yes stop_codon:yes gene_type:complete
MAKTTLNPGADATLVQAATNAAMANVPKDLSGTFESLADSYTKTMATVGESYGAAIKTVTEVGGQLVKNAIENYNKGIGSTGAMNVMTTGTHKGKSYADRLKEIRKDKFNLSLKFDDKSKKEKARLNAEKDRIIETLNILNDSDNFNNEQLMNNAINPEATGIQGLVMKQAMDAFKTTTGVIQEGPYKGFKAVLGDDANGDAVFMLQNDKGEFVTGSANGELTFGGEENYSISVSRLNQELLIPKLDGEKVSSISGELNKLLKSQYKTFGEVGPSIRSFVSNTLVDEKEVLAATTMTFGPMQQSLAKALNSPSAESAEIFAGLSGATLKAMGVDEMADNKKGYTEADFIGSEVAKSNYDKVKDKILDRENNYFSEYDTRKVLLDYVDKQASLAHNYTPTTIKTGKKNTGSVITANSKQWTSYEDQDKIIDKAQKGEDIYDWAGFRYTSNDGGKTYSIHASHKEKMGEKLWNDFQNVSTGPLLGGQRFTLSNRISSGMFESGNEEFEEKKELADNKKPKFNTKIKYGWGLDSQSISPENLLETISKLPGFIGVKEFARSLENEHYSEEGINNVMEIINETNGTNIKAKHLPKMVRDLVESMPKPKPE